MDLFSNPPIGWSENGLREGDLLEGELAYGQGVSGKSASLLLFRSDDSGTHHG